MTGKAQLPSQQSHQLRLQAMPVFPRAQRLAYIGRAAASGDEGALDKLLRALAPDMLRVIRAVVGYRHGGAGAAAGAVDRLLQDCVLAFVGALGQFRAHGSVAAFALAITFRHALAARRRPPAETLPPQNAAAPATPEPEPFPELESRRAVVSDLLASLPQAQAEALGLRLVVGLSIEEIARATGAPAVTVRSRLRVAKHSLRQALARDPDLQAFLTLDSAS